MITTFLLLVIVQLLSPQWWWIIVVPMTVGFWQNGTAWRAVRSGAGGAGLLWFAAAFHLQLTHAALIVPKIEVMVGAQSHFILLIAAATVALLCGGLGAWTGHCLRRAIWAPAQTGNPRPPQPASPKPAEEEENLPR